MSASYLAIEQSKIAHAVRYSCVCVCVFVCVLCMRIRKSRGKRFMYTFFKQWSFKLAICAISQIKDDDDDVKSEWVSGSDSKNDSK